MNRLGFDLMKSDLPRNLKLTLEVFKLNTLLFPKSGNIYDSYALALGERWQKAGSHCHVPKIHSAMARK